MLNYLMLYSLQKEEKELNFPTNLSANFLVIGKDKDKIISVYRKKFNFTINEWNESKIGKVNVGNNKTNLIYLDTKDISKDHGVFEFIINKNSVLDIYYLSRHGSVVDGNISSKNKSYLDMNSIVSLGNLNNGKHFEIKLNYELY